MAGFRTIAEIRDEHRSEVGGKAIGLARLARLGFAVLPAIAVEASFFDSIHARWPEEPEPEELARRIPPDLLRQLLAALDALGSAPAGFAVRSSAPLEDAGAASFAGVHETILRVARDSVPAALFRCWASGFSPRALEYRRRMGIRADPADIRMAAVVQVMGRPEATGVIFTREPAAGPGWVRIEAVAGSGDSPARGLIPPALFRVDARNRVERGNRADRPHLEDSILIRLAEGARRAESAWGEPLDLEWAVETEKIFFLQARPIANRAPESAEPKRFPGMEDRLWIRAVRSEVFPEILPPLLQSWLERIDRGGGERRRDTRAEAPAPAIRVIEGRLYFDPLRWTGEGAGFGIAEPPIPAGGTLRDLFWLLGRESHLRPEGEHRPGTAAAPGRSEGEAATKTDLQILSELREAEIRMGVGLARLEQSERKRTSAMRVLEWLLPDGKSRQRYLARSAPDGDSPPMDQADPRWLRPIRRRLIRRAAERLRRAGEYRMMIQDEVKREWTEPHPDRFEIGRRLTERGILERPADLTLLRMEEIERVLEGAEPGRDFRSVVARRRAECRRWAETRVPDRVRESEIGDLRSRPAASRRATGVIQGMPVGPGRAEGRVVVLEGPHQIDRVRRGDILVVPSLDPSWIPLLSLAGGLIVERGGSLTHGSILAREYALPVVANIPGITGILKTGERILLDGSAGSIVGREPSGGGPGQG